MKAKITISAVFIAATISSATIAKSLPKDANAAALAMQTTVSEQAIRVKASTFQTNYPFNTANLENFSALLGQAQRPVLNQSGHFLIYRPAKRITGVVVIVPGSEGVRDGLLGEHIRHFLAMSYAVAVVNSYTIRGHSHVLIDQAAISLPSQVLDVVLVMNKLRLMKEFSSLPMGLFGTSRGGMTISLLLDKRLLNTMNVSEPTWACVLYPSADVHYDYKTIVPVKLPFLYVVAQKDDEVSPQKAIDYSDVVHRKNSAMQRIVWPLAVHLFDAPFSKVWLAEGASALHVPEVIVTAEGLFHFKRKTYPTWTGIVQQVNAYVTKGIHIGYTNKSNIEISRMIKQFVEKQGN